MGVKEVEKEKETRETRIVGRKMFLVTILRRLFGAG